MLPDRKSARLRGLAPAALAAGLILAAPASASAATTTEAESFALNPTSAGGVFSDAGASGGKMLMQWSNAAATRSVSLPEKATKLIVRAKGDMCGDPPRMAVDVDGKRVLTTEVTTTGFADYTADVSLTAAKHTVKVSYVNDYYWSSSCDRNLYLDKVTFTGSAAPAPAPAPAPSPAPSSVQRLAGMETGNFSEFDTINSDPVVGAMNVDSSRAYAGSRSAHAMTPSGIRNKFARGIFNVNWGAGKDVWYGADFYLPSNFYSQKQSDVDILRWDNWSLAQRSQDQSGVTIQYNGRLAMLFKNLDTGEYTELMPSTEPLSAGAWHRIDVRQKFGGNGDAINELWVDGALAGRSTNRNFLGRPVTALRVGIVAVDANRQNNQLDIWFDRASISTGPLGR